MGPQAADGAQVTVTIPPGVTAISGLCVVLTTGTCGAVTVGASTPAGTPVTITLPTFPVGGRVEITLRGTAPVTPSTIINQAQVSLAGAIDPTPSNNVASVQTQILAGAGNTGTLSGRVWLDANHDRVFSAGEQLFQGYSVRIYDAAGTTLVTQVFTDVNGAYSVAALPAGVSYQIEFRDPAGNVVLGLPVTTESAGVGAGFASTTGCGALAETTPPNIVAPFTNGNCYSLTSGGSTAQVQRTGRILVALQPGDNVVEQSLPLDPSGVVYDAVTRQPVAGATVTFNGPAGFNPAQHLIGGATNQNQVTGADGFYQFLLINGAPAGTYTISVTPPVGYTSPSALIPPAGTLDPTGQGFAGVFPVQAQSVPPTGAQPTIYHLAFSLASGDPNVINNHVPLDPTAGAGGTLLLRKNASKTVAAVGDFVQYQLALSNPGVTPVNGVSVSDRLPPGFRYRAGTAQINGVTVANPTISADGRTLTFTIGTLGGGASREIRYVTEITVGASLGDAINTAQAAGAGGVSSLVVRAIVHVKEDLFRSRTILLGRVIEVGNSGPKLAQASTTAGATGQSPLVSADAGLCNPEQFFGKGVEGARIFMEDGTYVRTDKEGKWHIEGVKSGTHVVQLDVKSLPDGYEPVLCEDNTRHAGRAYSQFVNVRGGTLWRADFYVRNTGKSSAGYEAGHRLLVTSADGGLKATLELKGVTAGARNLSTTIALPKGLAYVPGSARMNGAAMAEPEVNDNMLVFRAGDVSGKWSKKLEFEVKGVAEAEKVLQAMSQFQSADGETRRLPPVQVSLDVRLTPEVVVSSNPEIIQYNQIVKEVTLSPSAKPDTKPVAAQPGVGNLNIYAPGAEKFDAVWLATAEQGLEIVYPSANFIPGINATKVFVKHHPSLKIKVTMNGVPVPVLSYDGSEQNAQKNVALSRWGGVGLQDGSNKIVAVAVDDSDKEIDRAERLLHFSGAGVEGRFVLDASTLVADGRTTPVIAVRIFDRDGKPARHGTEGELKVSAPYQSLEVVQRRDSRPLLDDIGNQARWRVTDDGIALIRLQPTTTSGEVVLTFNFPGRAPQLIRTWLKPELREWILVGLGEGTVGQRRISGALENLPADIADDKLWKDGRVAFYAKGQVKGDFLVTMAYDTDKERKRLGGNEGDRLLQTIDRKQYYTIYGDTTSAQHDAASTRKLYLKIEKNQWYALFGDFDTGMSVTELSRYSRTLNGVKSEFRGENISYTAFATKTAQAFVKDELRPDGTSGYYRLTRGNILPNSDKVTVETRDRFRNEVIIKSEPLSRGVDYEIDYSAGTLFFRKAIPGKDQNFNPIYVIADYESEDPGRDEKITAGGRVAVRTSDGKAEVGVSAIHEGTRGARGDLQGVDATYHIDDKTKLRAEYAQSKREVAGVDVSGNAYVVEVQRQDANVAATAYVRGQQGGFGLGQQAAAQSGTTKMGGDVSVKVTPEMTINARALHERTDNAGAQAQRSQVEARANYVQPDHSAYVGGRIVRDEPASGEMLSSNQIVAGGSQKFMDGRLNLRVDSEFDLSGGSSSVDFPNRIR
ncbi:MAG TPA: SdrD B-like domain-containing protein, partial [Burkholderiales bacterium]|nr:SdrD B-like domain-containing protein [Burkholderiales bacterium]